MQIWSDVVCPWCYIGKRRFEAALRRFPGAAEVRVEWRSFQLDPDMEPRPGESVTQYLAGRKGWSLEQARAAHERVTRIAAETGLDYRFERAVAANTFTAHRIIQLAKTLPSAAAGPHSARDGEMEERLFRAYFTEGRDLGDSATLQSLGEEAGLPPERVREVLAGDAFAAEVRADIREAQALGITGVPCFVFDRRFAVSGAQAEEVFLAAFARASAADKQRPAGPFRPR